MGELQERWLGSEESKGRTWKSIDVKGYSKEEPSPITAFTTTVKGDVVTELKKIHARRSLHSRRADESLAAKVTTDEEEWRKKPNRLDFPGVDTISPEVSKERASAAVFGLKKIGLHKATYEKYRHSRYLGQFFPHGKAVYIKKEVDLGWEGHPVKKVIKQKQLSWKPEIHVYKAPTEKYMSHDLEGKPIKIILQAWKESPLQRSHTIAHEAGHAFDFFKKTTDCLGQNVGGMFAHSKKIKEAHAPELLTLTKEMRGAYSSSKWYRESHEELFADAFSSFVLQPRRTKKLAPMLFMSLKQSTAEVFGKGWRKRFRAAVRKKPTIFD